MTMLAAAWRRRAEELAAWTMAHLVNRRDVWGTFIPLHRRKSPELKSWTAPTKARRGIDTLTEAVIERHCTGARVDHLVGLHSTSPENTSRWLGFDTDNHGDDADRARENLRLVSRLVAANRARDGDCR